MTALMTMLNVAYEVKEGRSFLHARLVAIALIFALGILVLGGAAIVVFGDNVLQWFSQKFGLESFQNAIWNILSYSVGFVMLITGISTLYTYAPNIDSTPRFFSAGSLFAVIAGLVVSFGFSVYLQIASMNVTYGSLGGVMVLMLWLYFMTFILMVGGEINSEIEFATGHGPGEKAKS
jgi:membrane protein